MIRKFDPKRRASESPASCGECPNPSSPPPRERSARRPVRVPAPLHRRRILATGRPSPWAREVSSWTGHDPDCHRLPGGNAAECPAILQDAVRVHDPTGQSGPVLFITDLHNPGGGYRRTAARPDQRPGCRQRGRRRVGGSSCWTCTRSISATTKPSSSPPISAGGSGSPSSTSSSRRQPTFQLYQRRRGSGRLRRVRSPSAQGL